LRLLLLLLHCSWSKDDLQFGERGYDIELNDDRLAPKPPHWEYMEEPARRHLYDRYADFIQMRKEIPAFTTKTIS